jgi:hypothetical protein
MRVLVLCAAILVGSAPAVLAQTTETATCKDGTTQTVTNHRGACSRHGGVASFAPNAAPGGGAGQVWVNSATKVYHCPGDRWYGKTKQGAYMTESAAKAEGDRPDHGKACS